MASRLLSLGPALSDRFPVALRTAVAAVRSVYVCVFRARDHAHADEDFFFETSIVSSEIPAYDARTGCTDLGAIDVDCYRSGTRTPFPNSAISVQIIPSKWCA